MTSTSPRNYARGHAILSAVTMAFVYSSHLAGKAQLGDLSDDEAHRLLKDAQETKARLMG